MYFFLLTSPRRWHFTIETCRWTVYG